jgi:uncharacterized protein
MTQATFSPDHLDVRAFAQNAAQLSGELLLSKLDRLSKDLYAVDADLALKKVSWIARGGSVPVIGGIAQSWLYLDIKGHVPLQCQRCLQAMQEPIAQTSSFRFVRDEAQASAQDDDAEEDLLVASKQFNLLELIEDELIMALPFAPTHQICPVPVDLQVSSADFEAALLEKPKAFAALGQLKLARKAAP